MFLNRNDFVDDSAPGSKSPPLYSQSLSQLDHMQPTASHTRLDTMIPQGIAVGRRRNSLPKEQIEAMLDEPDLSMHARKNKNRPTIMADVFNRPASEQETDSPGTDSSRNSNSPDDSSAPNSQARRLKLMQQQQQQMDRRKSRLQNTGMIRAEDDATPSPRTPSNVSQMGVRTMVASQVNTAQPVWDPNGSSAGLNAFSRVEQSATDLYELLKQREMARNDANLTPAEKDLLAQGIAPVFDPNQSRPEEAKLDIADLKAFLSSPAPKKQIVQCYITRHKDTFSNRFQPVFALHTKDHQLLMCAKKRAGNKTSNYIICTSADDFSKESAGFLGKVRANFVGTEFVAFDNGMNPKTARSACHSPNVVRQELSAVIYESNVLGSRGPRKMTCLVPKLNRNDTSAVFRSSEEGSSLVESYKRDELGGLMILRNKSPKWNDQVGAYVLNFNGRVTMASVKNFQLVFDDNPDAVILQFGRVDKDQFTMDFQHPLSPLQAFAICLSSLDYKFACE